MSWRHGRRALERLARKLAPRRVDLPLASWGLGRDGHGALHLDGVDLAGLLERWGSPLHVVDAARLASNARRFTARADDARGCEVFCSYKTNPVPGVLTRLHQAGIGAEVVSAYELWLALRLGVAPQEIVYNGPGRSESSLALAIRREVGLINLNARDELQTVARLARGLGRRPRVGLRVVPDGVVGGQFGEAIATGAALEGFREALHTRAVNLVALHAHPNGRLARSDELGAYLRALLAFTDTLHEELGFDPEILDLGGNLALRTVAPLSALERHLAQTLGVEPSAPRGDGLDIGGYVGQVTATVEAHYAARGRRRPRLFLEPGRALMGDAQLLLCRVTEVRPPDEAGITWAVLDAGINVAEAVRNEFHQLVPVQLRPGAPSRLHRLTGPSCTLADQLYPAWRTQAVELGDALAIMDSGAYFVPYATCFSQPRPGIAVVEHGRAELLRRPETFEDLVGLDLELPAAPQPTSRSAAAAHASTAA